MRDRRRLHEGVARTEEVGAGQPKPDENHARPPCSEEFGVARAEDAGVTLAEGSRPTAQFHMELLLCTDTSARASGG